jgi:hypothetical protein
MGYATPLKTLKKKSKNKKVTLNSRIVPLDVEEVLSSAEFIPQAVVGHDIGKLGKKFGVNAVRSSDDLDSYTALAWSIGKLPFTVMHYRGHPKGTSTIYLPRKLSNVAMITNVISKIIDRLGIEHKDLVWQRKDDPDL